MGDTRTNELLENCCEQLADMLDSRKELNTEIKELKERIEELMIANNVHELKHAGVALTIKESLKVKTASADSEKDAG